MWILKLKLENLDLSKVKWDEVEGTNGCPHYYSNFGKGDVVEVKRFVKGEGVSNWKSVFESEPGWLE